MAGSEDDTLELTEELEAPLGDKQAGEEQADASDSEESQDDDEETVTFGDEAAPASGEAETGLVKHLREQIKERDRRLSEIQKSAPQSKPIEVGPKPTLAGMEYDEEAYETALDQWKDRSQKAAAQAEEAQKSERQHAEAWSAEIEGHKAKKSALKFKDVQEAEDIVTATLSDVQQAVIVKAAENSAMVVYALGKHPGKLAELSKITDPLKLAAAVARLEGKLTVTKRGGPPEPERIARGSASVEAGSKDKALERLEKEADRTGDRSKLIAYKAKMKAQAK